MTVPRNSLPLDVLRSASRPVPADLTARGTSLFPELPRPSSVDDVRAATAPTVDITRFCEAFTFPVNFAVAGEQVVLPRQNIKRLGLLIVNTNIAGGIFYCFDTVAQNTNGVPITNGGNRLFDSAVPQGDLHISASGAGLVIIEYLVQSNY